MESAIKPVIVFLIAVLAIVFWCIRTVNDFKKKEIRVQEGISGIEVALTKRYDMLTKMLDTAKGYMGHESELFTKVIELRHGMSIAEMNDAQRQMDTLSVRFFAVAENYPELRSSSVLAELQRSIRDAEEHLQAARRLYNSNVPSTIRPSPCSQPSCWQARASRRNSSPQTQASAKI